MSNLDDIKSKLDGLGGSKKPEIPKNHLTKDGKLDRRHLNKRHPDSGRKPNETKLIERGIKAKIDEYAKTDVEIEVTDNKTGQKRMIRKPRVLWALETYFEIGMEMVRKNKDISGIVALDRFMDRALGKAAQPIRGEGEDDAPIRVAGDISVILKKAYGGGAEKED